MNSVCVYAIHIYISIYIKQWECPVLNGVLSAWTRHLSLDARGQQTNHILYNIRVLQVQHLALNASVGSEQSIPYYQPQKLPRSLFLL